VSQPARARGCFTRAADLARTILAVNPSDSQTISLLAVVEAKLGRPAEAERHALEAATLAPSSALVLYRQAVVGALTGRDSDALEALSRALKLGYSISEARQDDDLASLRHRADFRSLLAAGA
jgi:Flp pilus assembly protein TadD